MSPSLVLHLETVRLWNKEVKKKTLGHRMTSADLQTLVRRLHSFTMTTQKGEQAKLADMKGVDVSSNRLRVHATSHLTAHSSIASASALRYATVVC